ncbi:MAG: DUF3352 domain-containing protein [Oscillatoriales cyanobacterium RM2_1_1]|nr:DUF3352 domain-containing protein [Oscillatoriales cyanobacterium SM2_3_0]NJO46709.1 DUF3352 domain-containing protein [Oscillatoriales cyanobacterium RM2_1_1]
MKQPSRLIALAVVAILFLVGFIGFQWLGGRSSLKLVTGSRSVPEASIFVPENALAMGSFLVNLDDAESIQKALTASRGCQSSNEINRIRSLVLQGTGLNYNKDIRPWLGNEVTLALMTLDIDRNRKNGAQPGYLFALSTTDAGASRGALEKFWQRQQAAGETVAYEQYKGVQFTYRQMGEPTAKSKGSKALNSQGLNSQGLSTAAFGDRFVLFANSPKVLREAINDVQAASLSLDQSQVYQRAVQQLGGGQLGFVFLNLGRWGLDLTRADAVPTAQPSLALAISANPKGLITETALIATEEPGNGSAAPSLTQPIAALKYLPKSSPLVIAGTDLRHLWAEVEATLATTPQLQNLARQPLEIIKQLWGVDLAEDIFSWVTGEYALALWPRTDRPRPDWLFIAQRSPEAQAAIDQIDQIAEAQGYRIEQFSLGGQTLSTWAEVATVPVQLDPVDPVDPADTPIDPQIVRERAKGAHATVEDYEIFTTSVEAMDKAIGAAKAGYILNDQDFKTSLGQLPKENDGYLFLNWTQGGQLLQRQVPLLKIVELSARSFFDHLHSLTITSTGMTEDVKRATVFVQLR